MATCNIDATQLTKQLTLVVTIKNIRELKFRLWLGEQLIRLAAMIMSMNIEIEIENIGDITQNDCE